MAIFVYEPDPVVQSDIGETLAGAFPGEVVRFFHSVDAMYDALGELDDKVVAIVSDPTALDVARFRAMLPAVSDARFILVGNQADHAENPGLHFYDLPLPFSSSMLVTLVRNALSDLR